MVINRKAGERRYVELSATPTNPIETIVISSASWELKNCEGEVIDNGICDIDGDKFKCFLETMEKGKFHLGLTVVIGMETFKPDAIVVVE